MLGEIDKNGKKEFNNLPYCICESGSVVKVTGLFA